MSPIIRWEPFEPFADMDKMLEKSFAPAVDVYETKDSVVAKTPLAGVNPDDVEVSIENDILTIKGETKNESEVDDKDYYRKEVRQGSFHRAVALPTHVQGNKAEAEFEDGMLKVIIPKAEEVKKNPIKISVKKGKK